MEHLKSFLALAERIRLLTIASNYDCPLAKARSAPDTAASIVKRLRISTEYGSREMSKEENAAAQQIFKALSEKYRADGEIEKRRLLLEYSRELESIRACIVSSAARASIEIGVFARNLSEEAGDGLDLDNARAALNASKKETGDFHGL